LNMPAISAASSGVRLPKLPELSPEERRCVITFPSFSAGDSDDHNADLEILGMASLQLALTLSILETHPGIEKEKVEVGRITSYKAVR
jgi:hypothetical protein